MILIKGLGTVILKKVLERNCACAQQTKNCIQRTLVINKLGEGLCTKIKFRQGTVRKVKKE